ncbi:nucleolin 1 [Phtheirospermum japonicum]|uniref:Nucleolin 1 n=1 Tax=Phtheirospermum japonicum TaxID=374723 RepID=A0A830CE44_9LAMI|nr:nucleolin 1 [Phtheirospermum japonicum]
MNKDDDSFRGFGHVEFATAEQAEKALREMNGKELLRREIRLDLARERGERGQYTPGQKGPRSDAQTIFVKGFDSYEGEDQIRASLKAHFGSCGEIQRVSIPKGEDGNSKGIAYIEFSDVNARNQALELNGSEFGNGSLTVDEPRPRADNSGGGFRGGGRGSRDFGGRSGGRGRGDFGRGRGRGRDSGGRGNRGRGFNNRPSMATPGTGTFYSNLFLWVIFLFCAKNKFTMMRNIQKYI